MSLACRCDRSCQVQIGNEIRGADFDDQPVKRGVIWHLAAKIRDRIGIPEKIERQVDGDLYGAMLRGEVMPVFNCAVDDEIRKNAQARIVPIGHEVGRWNESPGGMPHPYQRLGAAQLERPRIEFRLIPELQPACVQRFGGIDHRLPLRFLACNDGHTFVQARAIERRHERRQHLEAALGPELPNGDDT
jgi:hypothetical protein